jgi:hypothetical protein
VEAAFSDGDYQAPPKLRKSRLRNEKFSYYKNVYKDIDFRKGAMVVADFGGGAAFGAGESGKGEGCREVGGRWCGVCREKLDENEGGGERTVSLFFSILWFLCRELMWFPFLI